ncbi:hypothetical protein PIROE2DRAFT_1302 [Piromyces sp. E2]|nr:hypothetical protein PIROE2DRAFT_1302 [Piromyces sp. E2]|eukprot:OUM70442.1 hypothetical protein PIROE2DRAFT_1302 [Piromyces sp. E2]
MKICLIILNHRKRKNDNKLTELFYNTNEIRNPFKRNKTEIDNFDNSIKTFKINSSVNTNKNNDNNNNINNSYKFYNENGIIHFNNNIDDKYNFNEESINKEKKYNYKHTNSCSSDDTSEPELNNSKFLRLLIEGKEEYLNSSSYIKNDSKSKIVQSNQKLSILPNDYDFSKIDEKFENLFDKSKEKIIPTNIKQFSSMFNESTIYPSTKILSKFPVDEDILNSTMINNLTVDVDNSNKDDLLNKEKNNVLLLDMIGNNNIEETVIINKSNMLLDNSKEEYEQDNSDAEDRINPMDIDSDSMERKKRKIKNIIVSDEEDDVSFIDTNKNIYNIDKKKKRESEIFKRQKIYIIDNDEEINNDDEDDHDNIVDNNDDIDDAVINDNNDVEYEEEEDNNSIDYNDDNRDLLIHGDYNNEVIVRTKKKKNLKLQTNFKKERFNITPILYKKFNKEIFENQLPFNIEINWSKTLYKTAGRTQMKRNKEKVKSVKIELSCKVLDNIGK